MNLNKHMTIIKIGSADESSSSVPSVPLSPSISASCRTFTQNYNLQPTCAASSDWNCETSGDWQEQRRRGEMLLIGAKAAHTIKFVCFSSVNNASAGAPIRRRRRMCRYSVDIATETTNNEVNKQNGREYALRRRRMNSNRQRNSFGRRSS